MQCQHQPGAILVLHSESIDFDDKIYVYFIKTNMSYMTKKNYLKCGILIKSNKVNF